MPIKIQDGLPAIRTLEDENIFVMTEKRAVKQDIRPLKILICNLMPTKIETETQLLRLLSNSPLQIEVEFLLPASHVSKNTSQEHLSAFYKTFDQVKDCRYDGMIITGAPGLDNNKRIQLFPYLLGCTGGTLPSLRHSKIRFATKAVGGIFAPILQGKKIPQDSAWL